MGEIPFLLRFQWKVLLVACSLPVEACFSIYYRAPRCFSFCWNNWLLAIRHKGLNRYIRTINTVTESSPTRKSGNMGSNPAPRIDSEQHNLGWKCKNVGLLKTSDLFLLNSWWPHFKNGRHSYRNQASWSLIEDTKKLFLKMISFIGEDMLLPSFSLVSDQNLKG